MYVCIKFFNFFQILLWKYQVTRKVDILNTTDVIGNKHTKCSLQAGTRYTFSVVARSRKGYGPDTLLNAWTIQGPPPKPALPVCVESSYSTISVRIHPVSATKRPSTLYLLLVETVTEHYRAKQGSDISEIPGYVTAKLLPSDVTGEIIFVVGDGQMYGGVFNRGLESATKYNIYYVVNSTLGGITRLSYAKINHPVPTVPGQNMDGVTTAQMQTTASESDSVPFSIKDQMIVVWAILGAILIVMIVLVVVLCRYLRRKPVETTTSRTEDKPAIPKCVRARVKKPKFDGSMLGHCIGITHDNDNVDHNYSTSFEPEVSNSSHGEKHHSKHSRRHSHGGEHSNYSDYNTRGEEDLSDTEHSMHVHKHSHGGKHSNHSHHHSHSKHVHDHTHWGEHLAYPDEHSNEGEHSSHSHHHHHHSHGGKHSRHSHDHTHSGWDLGQSEDYSHYGGHSSHSHDHTHGGRHSKHSHHHTYDDDDDDDDDEPSSHSHNIDKAHEHHKKQHRRHNDPYIHSILAGTPTRERRSTIAPGTPALERRVTIAPETPGSDRRNSAESGSHSSERRHSFSLGGAWRNRSHSISLGSPPRRKGIHEWF